MDEKQVETVVNALFDKLNDRLAKHPSWQSAVHKMRQFADDVMPDLVLSLNAPPADKGPKKIDHSAE